jgi:diguanylate cyclase (GGDEF)-like protein
VREILTGEAPLPDRLREFCLHIAERAGRGIATLYLRDSEDGDLRLSATSLEGGGFGGEYRVGIGQGIDGNAALTGKPSILRSAKNALSYAALPLVAGDVTVGVLSIQGGDEAPSGRAEEEMLFEIAAVAAEEISHAQRAVATASRATKMGALNESGIRMISTTDPAEVMRLATSAGAMALEADHAILRLQDEESGRYIIRSYFGSADGRLQERLFRLDKRVSVDAIKRRAPRLIASLSDEPDVSDADPELRSVIAAPLMREGRVIGTLAIYDKVVPERFSVGRFSDEDLSLFTKYVSYVERAVANANFYSQARRYRNFDNATGLPNDRYIEKRIQEEIARTEGGNGALALAVCLLENLPEIEQTSGRARSHRVVQRTVDALRSNLRDFDVLGRTADAEFTILLPDPGFSPGERVFALARAVADEVSKDQSLNDPIRISMGFGYAVYPAEGVDCETLLAAAHTPRIRMV